MTIYGFSGASRPARIAITSPSRKAIKPVTAKVLFTGVVFFWFIISPLLGKVASL
jgi:hypothetical protein